MNLIRLRLANNPKGGDLWVNRAHVVAVAPTWFNGAREQVIEKDTCVVHVEGGRFFAVQGTMQEIVVRLHESV